MYKSYQEIISRIRNSERKIAIYGVGRLAQSFYRLLQRNDIKTDIFVVSNYNSDINEYDGVPVYEFDSIKDEAENYNFIIAIEDASQQKKILDNILMSGGESIIRMDWHLIQDIYANFCADSSCEENLIKALRQEKGIVIYGAGKLGEILLDRLNLSEIKIEFFCVTNKTENVENINDVPVYSFKDVSEQMAGMAVIMAMENFETQKSLIKPLRNAGVERIYLLKYDLIKDIYICYRKEFLESLVGYQVLDNFKNIEIDHSVLVCEKGGKEYRWRIPNISGIPYSTKVEELFRVGEFTKKFNEQYGFCKYLSYSNDILTEITEPINNIEVYMAKFYKDTKINRCEIPYWVIPIQVGAALTDIAVADVRDDSCSPPWGCRGFRPSSGRRAVRSRQLETERSRVSSGPRR